MSDNQTIPLALANTSGDIIYNCILAIEWCVG